MIAVFMAAAFRLNTRSKVRKAVSSRQRDKIKEATLLLFRDYNDCGGDTYSNRHLPRYSLVSTSGIANC